MREAANTLAYRHAIIPMLESCLTDVPFNYRYEFAGHGEFLFLLGFSAKVAVYATHFDRAQYLFSIIMLH